MPQDHESRAVAGRGTLWVLLCVLPVFAGTACGQTQEKAGSSPARQGGAQPSKDAHPLDPALAIARDGLQHLRENVRDYTATLVKRERISGQLGDYQYLFVKIRHPKTVNGRVEVPFSVYLKFLGPKAIEGREVIWVEGRNQGKLIAHETGFKNLLRIKLEPDGFVAMMGNRYPIMKIGFINLVEELLQKGEQERKYGECDVQFYDKAKVDGRVARKIEVTHPVQRPYFQFYRAQIFIDEELNVPIRYAAWSWPESAGSPPTLEEEYTYRNIRLNVGLTDRDFDPDNAEYKFP